MPQSKFKLALRTLSGNNGRLRLGHTFLLVWVPCPTSLRIVYEVLLKQYPFQHTQH